jgi:hypothetical protein
MRKRAVDLSLEELAAMGANAALTAAQKTYAAGLSVAGTADVVEGGRVVSSLVERHPSGAVTGLDASAPDAATDILAVDISKAGKSAD